MKKIFLLTALGIIAGSFFVGPSIVQAAVSDIIINEIGAYEATNHEWIEIYNKGAATVDLSGWKFYENETNHSLKLYQGDDLIIEPGEYAIIADVAANFAADYPNFTGTIIDSSWINLKESGELIELRASADPADVVESFTYLAAPDFSLERADPNLADYTAANWQEHASGNTAGSQNSNFGQPPADTMAPEDATNLAAAAGDGLVDLSWSSSVSQDAAGYKLYVDSGAGYDSGTDLGNVTSYQAANLTNGLTYTFKITVYDQAGNESAGVTIQAAPSAPATPSSDQIVINEFIPDPSSGENEWIELFNKEAADVNLENWTLEDGVGVLKTFAAEDVIATGGFLVWELSSSKLNNTGDIIILKNDQGTVVDQVTYDNWDDGDTADNAPAVADPNSLARLTDGDDSDIDNNDWQITATPTKGTANVITAPVEENNGDGNNSGDSGEQSTPPSSGGGAPTISFNPGELVINELVSDPADGEVEWVELYNNTAASINLSGWTLEDGGETMTKLSGFIDAKGFWIIEKPKGILNNAGDALFLKFNSKIIDQLTYGNWDDGELSDNAPRAADPYSLARIADGQDTNNDFNDFIIATPTKGEVNIAVEGQAKQYSADIIINELLPNPQGPDTQKEFIELKNIGSNKINLEEWILGDGSTKRYKIKKEDLKSTILGPGEFLTLYRAATGLALNNSGGDSVKLFAPDEKLMAETIYTGKANENQSYAREESGKWSWTTIPTPQEKNQFTAANQPPQAVIEAAAQALMGELITFDASDSYDPDGNELSYSWNFGNGGTSAEVAPLYFYSQPGSYEVILTVTDNQKLSSTAKMIIKISAENNAKKNTDIPIPNKKPADDVFQNIIITEFLPNPEGSDINEWIELKNTGEQEINLAGWQLDDEEGGSRPYVIPPDTLIRPGEYLVFKKAQTRLALNNSADSARLLDPDGNPLVQIDYQDVVEGASYARDANGIWQWSSQPTPGGDNKIAAPLPKTSSRRAKKIKPIIETTLEKAREQDAGDRLRVRGTVSAPPGVLGKQVFYLAGSGIQIYMHKKNFPDLKIGDYVEVTGELSRSGGESRIKVKEKSDIKILKRGEAPKPHSLSVGEINENTEGYLATIEGEVIETRGSSVFVDDGSDEVKVYIKSSTNINAKLKEGDLVKITGIVSQTRSGYRLLPRFSEDIKILENNIAGKESAQTAILEKTVKDQTAVKYLSATTMALVIALGGLMIRMRKEVRK